MPKGKRRLKRGAIAASNREAQKKYAAKRPFYREESIARAMVSKWRKRVALLRAKGDEALQAIMAGKVSEGIRGDEYGR